MNLTLKFVFIGDAGAGKTAINHKFITGKFDETMNKSTVGVIFSCKQFKLQKYKTPIKVHFWDTAGQKDSDPSYLCIIEDLQQFYLYMT